MSNIEKVLRVTVHYYDLMHDEAIQPVYQLICIFSVVISQQDLE